MTIMFDNNYKIIQWYIDISNKVFINNNISYQEDLYLDLVILPNKEKYILDVDELKEALSNSIITRVQYDLAFRTLYKVAKKYAGQFQQLVDFTNYIGQIFIKNQRLLLIDI